MSRNLFAGSDDSDGEDLQLSTNKEYAKIYNTFREKELLKKFKDRGYDVADSDCTSDSETSSEEDEPIDSKFDQEFLQTLASLKSKDPTIYDKNTKFFQDLEDGGESTENTQKEKQSKSVTLKDYERQIILERGGKFEDDSDDDSAGARNRSAFPTVVEEERRLKDEFKKAINANDDEDETKEDAFGGIFTQRKKSKEEQEKEEADYLQWLAGKRDDIEDKIKTKLEPLKNYWSSNKLPQSERFLRDFILNKGYTRTKTAEVPTYDEIVGDKQPLSEDERELEKQEEFEQKYNFRFEEPDAEFIKRYPRTIEQSLRQSDDRRKQKRQEIKERKKLEKEQKMKELDLVKEMKRKEIEDKIRKLKMVTGNEELGFKDEELEEDFDPEAHDKRMQELFNDEYYQVDEGEEKPECPSDIEELKVEDWDNYNPNMDYGEDEYDPHCEDEDFNMDCEYDPIAAKERLQKDLIENTKRRKGRKGRKSQFMEMIKLKKPAFDPVDEKTYEEYIDEYYKLDCEDMIGDIPCRFKYVETTPNDFGLTIEEILLAKNKELNQWASLKKAIQIRPDQVEKKDQRLYKMKAKNEALKRKIFKSLYGEGSDDEDDQEQEMNAQDTSVEPKPVDTDVTNQPETVKISKKTKKRKKRKAQSEVSNIKSADNTAHLKVPAKNPKLEEGTVSQAPNECATPIITPETRSKKKKKKSKTKKTATTTVDTTSKTAPVEAPSQQTHMNGTVHHTPEKHSHLNPFKVNSQVKNKSSNKNVSLTNVKEAQKSNKNKANASNPFKKNEHKTQNGYINKKSAKKLCSFIKSKKKQGTIFNQVKDTNSSHANISDERLKAYGINPKKFHKKLKYGKPPN